ncbi:3-oxoadipate enol-lactonase 2 [Variovorax sp. SRS16]|uniref:alpha/beta fold hydrolase n=1 Tax=Variovorax sp. SRS16 TaxID=282217 RepID=UPI0013195A15|nr:alpha/beta fold hydrolase [Variovorax sp. SRS16]VTU13182.1 3-oxoadipate enol-lactonase 2 [Variovorax sp. SRS16]
MNAVQVQFRTRGSLAYSIGGDGPALVLLHPIGMDRSLWAPYMQHWLPRYRVIAADMLGHGESGPIRGSVSLADHACAVLEVIEAEGLASAVVMGVSMGGMVAQSMAIAAPDRVQGLVLCATAGGFPEASRAAIRSRGDSSRRGDMSSEVIESTAARWFASDTPSELVERCCAKLALNDWHSWSVNWEAISELDHLSVLSRLTMPALVVAGDRDASIPVAVSKELADALKADFVVLENSAHFGAFDAPQRIEPVVDRFLARLHADRVATDSPLRTAASECPSRPMRSGERGVP